MKVGIIGSGGWGTALACVLSDNGHKVVMWSHKENHAKELQECRENRSKLPGVKLPDDVICTADMAKTIEDSGLLVLAVPSVATRTTARKMRALVPKGQVIVCVAKGIEEGSCKTVSEITAEEIPEADVAVMCGPSHAEEVGLRLPTTVVAGAVLRKTAERIQAAFMNEVFRVYTSPDMVGMELGGALKNVIALAAGMADGLGFGDNTKAALITRGITEINRLAVKMGARRETLGGLTGIGDLIVTCESRHSRNRRAGMLIGQGYTMEQAMEEVKMVVEGVYSAKAALTLAQKYQVELPIIEEVNHVLFDHKSAKDAVAELMLRNRRTEHAGFGWEEHTGPNGEEHIGKA